MCYTDRSNIANAGAAGFGVAHSEQFLGQSISIGCVRQSIALWLIFSEVM